MYEVSYEITFNRNLRDEHHHSAQAYVATLAEAEALAGPEGTFWEVDEDFLPVWRG